MHMKFLVSLWKFLSVPCLAAVLWLGWWGWTRREAASALARPVSLATLQNSEGGTFWVRDSFLFDLTSPGLRQENNYGIKGPALAVFPVAALADTLLFAPITKQFPGHSTSVAVVSAQSRFVGPAVATFLRPDSMAIVDIRVSSNNGQHIGSVAPEMQALIQITADKLGHGPLGLPRRGTVWIEGLAQRLPADKIPDVIRPMDQVWVIRTGEVANMGRIFLAFGAAVALLALFIILNVVVRNYDRAELEREIAEREEEKGLV